MILKLKKKIIFRILKSYKLFLKSDKKHQIINEMMKKRIFIDKKNILDTYFFGELIDESDLIIKQYFFQTFIRYIIIINQIYFISMIFNHYITRTNIKMIKPCIF